MVFVIVVAVILFILFAPVCLSGKITVDLSCMNTRAKFRVYGLKVYDKPIDYEKVKIPKKDYTFLLRALTFRHLEYIRICNDSEMNYQTIMFNLVVNNIVAVIDPFVKMSVKSQLLFSEKENLGIVNLGITTSVIRIVAVLLKYGRKNESSRPNRANS